MNNNEWKHPANPPEAYYPCLILAIGKSDDDKNVAGKRVFLGYYNKYEKEWEFCAEYGFVLEPSGSEKIMLYPSLNIIAWKRIFHEGIYERMQ